MAQVISSGNTGNVTGRTWISEGARPPIDNAFKDKVPIPNGEEEDARYSQRQSRRYRAWKISRSWSPSYHKIFQLVRRGNAVVLTLKIIKTGID